MTQTLAAPPSLEQLAAEGPLSLFLDFDGTLVAIAPTHDAIEVPPDMAGGLETLSQRLDGRVALVSGRSLDNLAGHLGPCAVAQAGSHGIDRRLADGSRIGSEAVALPGDVAAALEEFVGGHAELTLETKPHGAALHYRAAPSLEEQVLAHARKVADEAGMVTKRGKFVVELVRPGADKGGAVDAFMEEAAFSGTKPVFIGDDVTDEDGFAAANRRGGFAIAVGERPTQNARYRLATPADVRDWLGL